MFTNHIKSLLSSSSSSFQNYILNSKKCCKMMACILLWFQKFACVKRSMLSHILGNSYFFPTSLRALSSWNLTSVHRWTLVLFQSLKKIKYSSYFHHICLISMMSCFHQLWKYNGQYPWYCGNADEKLHNILKVSPLKYKIMIPDPISVLFRSEYWPSVQMNCKILQT